MYVGGWVGRCNKFTLLSPRFRSARFADSDCAEGLAARSQTGFRKSVNLPSYFDVLMLVVSALHLAPTRSPRATCSMSGSLDDFARKAEQAGLLRAEAAVSHESGALWQGAQPDAAYSPQEVIELTLSALQNNDDPKPHSGTALLRRFSSDRFLLAGEPRPEDRRLAPPELTAFFRSSQYGLLLEPACYSQWTFPSETCSLDDEEAWQEVKFETQAGTRGENTLLAKLGWSLVRDGHGCWVTDDISWHDFRDSYRPGIGQEEWPRICG